jgi:agmatinase
LGSGEERKMDETSKVVAAKINEGCENLNVFIKSITKKLLSQGKMIGILGGDHSVPLGFLRALSEKNHDFGILQIDAHADLRKSYQNFSYSHASIMHHALKLKSVSKLIQVGVRDKSWRLSKIAATESKLFLMLI